jgi:hypothetical protein
MSESKLQTVSAYTVGETLGTRFDHHVYLPVVGTAGGIVVAWCSVDVRVLAHRVDDFSVSIQLELEGGAPWWLTTVYDPTSEDRKAAFLDEVRALRAALAGPWALAGDFSMITNARDKNNSNLNRRAMARFRALLNDLKMRKSCLLGRRYTWSNERDRPTLAQLDRWFCDVDWTEMFPDATLSALSSSLSYHCSICMSTSIQFHAKRRFRFEKFWTKLGGFLEVVESSWTAAHTPAEPLRRLDHKLRRLARNLQHWSSKQVGNIRDQILVTNEVIFRLEAAQDSRALATVETDLRSKLKLQILGLASLERTIARQRARVTSIKECDAAIQFFRICSSTHARHGYITCLRNGDVTADDQGEKEELASQFFARLLGQGEPCAHDRSLSSMGLPQVDLSELEDRVTDAEIWTAVHAMPGNKSPWPDGYTWEFYHLWWDVIKVDIAAAIRAIFSGRYRDLHWLNGTLIALIPKKEGVVDLKEFRPISLVHSFAKLMAKILALRLAPRMSDLVDCSQSAFIRGHCIHDNFVLVHQSTVALHRWKLLALLIKLDVARAFDSVAWPFLISVLRQHGFGPRWVRWIISLLSSANTRVLVNGAAGNKVRHGRGLRQGDPLSPLLFVLIMDVVAAMFRAAEASGVLSPFLRGYGTASRFTLTTRSCSPSRSRRSWRRSEASLTASGKLPVSG